MTTLSVAVYVIMIYGPAASLQMVYLCYTNVRMSALFLVVPVLFFSSLCSWKHSCKFNEPGSQFSSFTTTSTSYNSVLCLLFPNPLPSNWVKDKHRWRIALGTTPEKALNKLYWKCIPTVYISAIFSSDCIWQSFTTTIEPAVFSVQSMPLNTYPPT